jgi:hypothetical protein
MRIATILLRATLLCALGICAYFVLARLSGVPELAEIQEIVLLKLRLKRPPIHISLAPGTGRRHRRPAPPDLNKLPN